MLNLAIGREINSRRSRWEKYGQVNRASMRNMVNYRWSNFKIETEGLVQDRRFPR